MAFWIAPVAMGLLQTGYGMYQSNQARQELKRLRAQREELRPGIPEDVNRMVSRAEQRHLEGMPGRDRQEAALRRSTATSVSAVREGAMTSSQYLEGVAEAYRGEREGLDRLATQEAVFRSQAEERVQQALSTRAGFDYQAQMLPYQEVMGDMGIARQAGQAGMQNIWSGVQTAAGGVMQGMMQTQRLQELDMIYGNGGDLSLKSADTSYMTGLPQTTIGGAKSQPRTESGLSRMAPIEPTVTYNNQHPPLPIGKPYSFEEAQRSRHLYEGSPVIGVGFSLNQHMAEGYYNNTR